MIINAYLPIYIVLQIYRIWYMQIHVVVIVINACDILFPS